MFQCHEVHSFTEYIYQRPVSSDGRWLASKSADPSSIPAEANNFNENNYMFHFIYRNYKISDTVENSTRFRKLSDNVSRTLSGQCPG